MGQAGQMAKATVAELDHRVLISASHPKADVVDFAVLQFAPCEMDDGMSHSLFLLLFLAPGIALDGMATSP